MQGKVTGIYMIKCLKNDKVYIGQSNLIYNRIWRQLNNLKQNKHENEILQDDFNKYGISNFSITILEIDCDDLDNKEKYYIDKYNSYNTDFGYNRNNGGKKGFNRDNSGKKNPMYGKGYLISGEKSGRYKYTKEIRQQIYDLLNSGLKIKEISEKLGCSKSIVYRIKKDGM